MKTFQNWLILNELLFISFVEKLLFKKLVNAECARFLLLQQTAPVTADSEHWAAKVSQVGSGLNESPRAFANQINLPLYIHLITQKQST